MSLDEVLIVSLDFGSDTSQCRASMSVPRNYPSPWGELAAGLRECPMSSLVLLTGYSAAIWLNHRTPLITQMCHQTFSIEKVTMLLISGSVHQDSPRSVKEDGVPGHSTTLPKSLRL